MSIHHKSINTFATLFLLLIPIINITAQEEDLGINDGKRNLNSYREIERKRYANLYGDLTHHEVVENAHLNGKESIEVNKVQTDSIANAIEKKEAEKKLKIAKISKDFPHLKYRRSSLYTLMVDDELREFSNNIANSFANFHIQEKFNEHNVGPYLIPGEGGDKEQLPVIETFLTDHEIAKKLVSRWFNRNKEGLFDMHIVAERGFYSASDLDIKTAENSQRGLSLLGDAGEELIKNTFVIVNDYKFTNKEVVAEKASSLFKLAGALTNNDDLASLASDSVEAVGKGYIIKVNSYLFSLEWTEETAAIFYNDFWIDKNYFDESKKKAFEETNIFKLKFVGMQSAHADVQSTIFSGKGNRELIIKATSKASDKALAKLQRQYEEFRTTTPLYSTDPLTAKIGTKEGLEKGDKYEVLEQTVNKEGKTEYKRKAVIKVNPKKIWNNSFAADDDEDHTQEIDKTHFSGKGKGLYSGMLIRQIN